ncbi:MAG: serine/threonine-protein kinase, partial [Verrucomicrobiota bacterium]
MELVRGTAITTYCDEQQLPVRERLELFVSVCDALHHAHQKGIIHRDIKPSNVMVTVQTERAVPVVIDFGVAKALEQRLTEETLFTQFGQVIGTLRYMSPEQAALDRSSVDTRSDIYSLGVLLYEILTGDTPISMAQVEQSGFIDVLTSIREEDPPSPSTSIRNARGRDTSANRKSDTRRLWLSVRGEIDWIVMKAMDKDRNRRYETAWHFARDIGRFLSHEPLEASPPSRLYRTRKFVLRHRLAAVSLVFATLLLVAITAGSLWFAAFSRQQEFRQRILVSESQAARDAAEWERDRVYAENYLSDMRVVQQDWDNSQILRMYRLLAKYIPEPGQPDLRRWEWYYLLSRLRMDLGIIRGHPEGAYRVRWHPSGEVFGMSDVREKLTFYRASDLGVERTIPSAGREVFNWSRDGNLLVAGTRVRQRIRVRDWHADKRIRRIGLFESAVLMSEISPDSRWVACATPKRFAVVSLDTGKILRQWPGRAQFASISWSADSAWVAQNATIKHVAGEEKTMDFEQMKSTTCGAFHPSQPRFAFGRLDGRV